MTVFAAFRIEDSLSSNVHEATLSGTQFTSEGMTLKVVKGGRVLRTWQLPNGIDSKKLKGAMETAALQYYWEQPGKNLSAGRPDYAAYVALTHLYNDLVDVSLSDWMEARNYEYELEAEATFRNRTVPVVLTCTCDGSWFRISARLQIDKGRHKRDDLVLTRDYSSAVNTTLEDCLNDMVTTSSKIIAAAMDVVDEPEPAPAYGGVAKEFFGYRKKE